MGNRVPEGWWGAARAALVVAYLAAAAASGGGCGFGPRALEATRLRYNEVVKSTAEEQLLLNIVRLRYGDSPSSLSVSGIASQFELQGNVQLTPFFTAAGGDTRTRAYGTALPGAGLFGADRPTITLTPQDDQEFTRRLFTPLTLDGLVYLARTTWPIQTVFRLYLENLNWVPNAQTASGPTPGRAPPHADFIRGVRALGALQERGLVVFGAEEREERVGGPIPAGRVTAVALVEAAKAGLEYRPAGPDGAWALVRKVQKPVLRIDPAVLDAPDVAEFVRTFRLKPRMTQYDLTTDALSPFPATYPPEGVTTIDLETRSLLQALYFASQGVAVPPEHAAKGWAAATRDDAGEPFDWQRVLGGLFKVASARGRRPPAGAHVAVKYRDYWFYIDESDLDTKATFSLLMELSRLELNAKGSTGPLLTLPLMGG